MSSPVLTAQWPLRSPINCKARWCWIKNEICEVFPELRQWNINFFFFIPCAAQGVGLHGTMEFLWPQTPTFLWPVCWGEVFGKNWASYENLKVVFFFFFSPPKKRDILRALICSLCLGLQFRTHERKVDSILHDRVKSISKNLNTLNSEIYYFHYGAEIKKIVWMDFTRRYQTHASGKNLKPQVCSFLKVMCHFWKCRIWASGLFRIPRPTQNWESEELISIATTDFLLSCQEF